jgi:hypothetical protein
MYVSHNIEARLHKRRSSGKNNNIEYSECGSAVLVT